MAIHPQISGALLRVSWRKEYECPAPFAELGITLSKQTERKTMDQEVLDILMEAGAHRRGHFVFKGGKHCSAYTRPDDLVVHTAALNQLVGRLAKPFTGEVDAVMGPSFGGNALALLVSAHMSRVGRPTLWIPTAKDGDNQIVEPDRGFEERLR
jgi:hypothetical protein